MKADNTFKHVSLLIVWCWLILFALVPFCLIMTAGFMSHNSENLLKLPLTIQNYVAMNDNLYFRIFEKSFLLAGATTFFCLIIGYPFAFVIGRTQSRFKNLLIMLVIIPFWTSSLIRSYALIAIIKAKGLINTFLIALHVIDAPLPILFTNTAVIIGLIYNLLPFMILPIMTNVERLDTRLIDAARDLGANKFTTFRKIIIPLTLPGILSGSILVFLPAMTMFYIPDILGGAKSILLGNLIQNQFMVSENWPMGAAFSAILTLVLASLIALNVSVTRKNKKRDSI